jgi:predicted DCC family thiol-disulfide oxidoreductase YuxK
MARPVYKAEQILIYDGECRLCVTAKEGLERLGRDPSVRYVPYQSDEAAPRLGEGYRTGRPDVAYLIGPGGQVQRGFEAFLPLLPGLPGGRVLTALAHIPLFKGLAALVYRLVAKNRYRWFGTVRSPGSSS